MIQYLTANHAGRRNDKQNYTKTTILLFYLYQRIILSTDACDGLRVSEDIVRGGQQAR
jgi:hypothetical protein